MSQLASSVVACNGAQLIDRADAVGKQIPIAWGEAEAAVVDAFIHNSKV